MWEGTAGSYILTTDGLNDIIWWCAKQFCDDGELIDVVFARKERFALEHFGEDASCAPYIDFDIVLLPREHDFGCSIVSRRDITSHLRILNTRKAKVADFEVAILVDQNITRLEIAVNDACRMYIFEATLRDISLAAP